ncbi:hypothetical protein MKEN_00624000 [Mycena kentingensis (nom. inval.)]|nr:hypothetical protein MKEN_00624000 [Mycena kentingensis (nom. inval.)]
MKAAFAVLLTAALVAAAPAETPVKRTPGNVFACVDANFGPPCALFHGSSGQCVNITPDFNDKISSFGPDPAQDCFIFSDINCQGQQAGPFRSPGIPNLANIGLNDQVSSFKCFFG